MILRDYQKAIAGEALQALESHKRIVVACPTGSGKTAIAMHGLIPNMAGKIAWVTHRKELANQAVEHGRPIDVFMAQRQFSGSYSAIIIDEGHHVCAAQYRRIISANPAAKIIALTATPYRLDGVGLGSCGFTRIIHGPDAYDLTVAGVLCPVRVFVPKSENVTAWTTAAAAKKICETKFSKGIVFCRSVNESKELANAINAGGIEAASVDGETVHHKRKQLFGRFAIGELRVICNHTIFTEGVDVPGVDLVVMNRHTLSRCLWKQMVGRGTRKADGKTECAVMDLAGNGVVHGSIYDKEIYDLSGKVMSTEQRSSPCEQSDFESKQYKHNQGEELKEWKPQPKPVRIIESLQRLKSQSPLRRFATV